MIEATFILITDRELIQRDVPLHARPFHVVIAWMKEKGLSGNLFAPELWEPLMTTYKQIYPSGDFTIPSMVIGGVGLRDQMYLARINVGYGSVSVDPIKCIDIPWSELEIIWKEYPCQVWRAIYSVADLWDFAYGVDDLREQVHDADQLWSNARSAIASTARTLTSNQDIDSAVQTAHLSAELAMKGVLTFLGWPEPRLRKLKHNLSHMAEAIIAERPGANDNNLRRACTAFPNYVETRYGPHDLTRMQLMALGMRGQFVAAEAIRRVSMRDFVAGLKEHSALPPREDL